MNTKKAIRVNLDVSISTSCSGTFTPVEEAVNQFLLQLDYYMARNWENEVAGVNESFGNRYKIQINGMKKAFNQLSQALLKLEEDCPGIKKIKWK